MLTLRPNLERAKRSKSAAVGTQTKRCLQPARMAAHGYKEKFKLLLARPQLNGKADPNPRVECGICGFVFNGGTTRQKHHLRREKGKGVSICTEISSKDPALLAELQREQQQEMDNQQLQQARKRASSSASSSIPTKQQRLDGHLVRADKQKLYASIATFFYAEGIPFAKVRGAAQCSEAALNTQLVHAGR